MSPHRDTPGLELAPQDVTKDMAQAAAHTYTSTEAVYEEIDPNYKAYLRVVREGGVVASSDRVHPTEGVQVDVPEGEVQ